MKNLHQFDLAQVIIDLELLPKSDQNKKTSCFDKCLKRVSDALNFLFEIYSQQVIIPNDDKEIILQFLLKLLPQITKIQEMIFGIDQESMAVNRLDASLEAMLELLITVLKETKLEIRIAKLSALKSYSLQ